MTMNERLCPKAELLSEYVLAARLAHEFSNVLAVVHSAAEGIAETAPRAQEMMPRASEGAGSISEDGAAILACAKKAARWTQRLTKLNVARSRMIVPTDLSMLPIESARLQVELGSLPGARLAIELRPLSEVVREIVQNAEDASATWLRVSAEVQDSSAVLCFEDNGHGIAAEIRAHVFEPLFTTRPPARGKGVGLCIIDAAVRAAGGTVALECHDAGTTVALHIPLAPMP
jgi:C4-dicarboxylate-specific signal transduction histidine kinase